MKKKNREQNNIFTKIIITTEKDATRLSLHKDYITKHQMPIYVLPAKVSFVAEDGQAFDEEIKKFLLEFKA